MVTRRQTEKIMEANQIKHAELERMFGQIHSLPAGSLSGGQRVYDPDDRRTFYLSPDPEERAWAKDLYGIDGSDPFDGLTHGEKKILEDAAERQVAGITPETVSSAKRQNREDQNLKSVLWQKYQASHPSTAQAEFNAVGDAGARILQRYGAEVVRSMAKHDPQALVDELEQEVWMGDDSGAQAPSAAPDDSRANGLSYGGGGSRSRRPFDRDDEPPAADENDIMADIKAWQRKTGFH